MDSLTLEIRVANSILTAVARPAAALSGILNYSAGGPQADTRGTPEECADAVLACIYIVQSVVE